MPSYTFCDKDELNKDRINAVPVENILGQYRKRYLINTEKCGTIVLRYLPNRMKKHLDLIRNVRYPKHAEIEEELMILSPLISAGECDDEQKMHFARLIADIRPTLDLYILGCIEYPFITNLDELDSLLEQLTDDEREVMLAVLEVLTAHIPPSIDVEYLEICDRFKVPAVDKDLIKNMTLQEYEVLYNVIASEAEAIKKQYKSMGVSI